MQKYMAVSSVKTLTLDLKCSGRSFMYARNKMGLRTEPWRMPEVTGIIPESQSPLVSRMALFSDPYRGSIFN